MSEPIVIINGISTEDDDTIPYVDVVSLDTEIFKTEIFKAIHRKLSHLIGFNPGNIYFVINSISTDVYKYVLAHGSINTGAVISLARVLSSNLQFYSMYVSVNDLIEIISSHIYTDTSKII